MYFFYLIHSYSRCEMFVAYSLSGIGRESEMYILHTALES